MADTPSKQERSKTTIDQAAMERLRDRTDELELIISSLTIFALFSLPGWLFNKFADSYTHLSTGFTIAGSVTTVLLTGVCYGLGACFIVHLMARAYWVGLIGLRAAFPRGINWDRTPTLGPFTKKHYRDSLPSLDGNIQRTDRLASSLFAVISMLTLSVLWFGTILVITLVIAGTAGAQFGHTNALLIIGAGVLFALFAGAPLLAYLLDAQLAARVPSLGDNRVLAGLIDTLRRIAGLAYPKRLILPVQLTLQSNTRPLVFFVVLLLAMFIIVAVGNFRVAGWQRFTLSSEFTYLTDEQVRRGFRSTYYEDMASPKGRLRPWPRINSFTQRGSFVRLFLPYHPLRDNLVLDELCPDNDAEQEPIDCLGQLWSVRIAGRAVPLEGFVIAQRSDLGMRGLMGVVPLSGLRPGMHHIEVVWNPNPKDDTVPVDDRYLEVSSTFRIPIVFAPDYELGLD